jgi:hypothetical protein
MLDLQPLIARLVDDLLLLIREASIEELRELLGPADVQPSVPRRRAAPRKKPRPAPKPAAQPKRQPAPRQARASVVAAPAPEPPAHGEITDPELLLAVAAPIAPTPSAVAGISVRLHAAPVAAEEKELSPPSGHRPAAASSIVLRSGETVAHVSERGGVVIRRRKGA